MCKDLVTKEQKSLPEKLKESGSYPEDEVITEAIEEF